MILPMLGGSPSVWNTCMVFFQGTLLLGYLYSHASISYLGIKRQAILHLALILLPLLVLPIRVPGGWTPSEVENPIPWLLLLLFVSIGLPFFIVSCSAPMLQKWFASTSHKSAGDPYFLYVASNLGSMLILLAYPTLLEPNLKLIQQTNYWFYTYCLLLVLIAACAGMLWVFPGSGSSELSNNSTNLFDNSTISAKQKLMWIALSFVPSSLMLGVTTYFSTDISPIPLFWIVPLSIYLLTFILVFSKKTILDHELMIRIAPYVVLIAIVYKFSLGYPLWMIFLLHLLVFFVLAMVCHGELARTRPPTQYLTEFYLWISVGGFLGGMFNALVAPVIFKEVIEYPLAIVLACMLLPALVSKKGEKSDILGDIIYAAIPGLIIVGLKYWINDIRSIDPMWLRKPYWLTSLIIYGLPAIVCLRYATYNSIRFGLGVGAIILVYSVYYNQGSNVIYSERNFFGIHRISIDKDKSKYSLYHGTTLHGAQNISEKEKCIPLTYYSRGGPIGQLFNAFSGEEPMTMIAAVGVGTGSVACYGKEGQDWVFYEIDPSIVKLNNEAKYFTYFKNAKLKSYVVYGDGRLSLEKAPDNFFELIILDAFSSDAIPVHLLTREALALYLRKLAEGGILALHTSNRYLNLPPVVANLARDAGIVAYLQKDSGSGGCGEDQRMASEWILIAREKEDLGVLAYNQNWEKLEADPKQKVWTDDYSNVFSIIDWGKF